MKLFVFLAKASVKLTFFQVNFSKFTSNEKRVVKE